MPFIINAKSELPEASAKDFFEFLNRQASHQKFYFPKWTQFSNQFSNEYYFESPMCVNPQADGSFTCHVLSKLQNGGWATVYSVEQVCQVTEKTLTYLQNNTPMVVKYQLHRVSELSSNHASATYGKVLPEKADSLDYVEFEHFMSSSAMPNDTGSLVVDKSGQFHWASLLFLKRARGRDLFDIIADDQDAQADSHFANADSDFCLVKLKCEKMPSIEELERKFKSRSGFIIFKEKVYHFNYDTATIQELKQESSVLVEKFKSVQPGEVLLVKAEDYDRNKIEIKKIESETGVSLKKRALSLLERLDIIYAVLFELGELAKKDIVHTDIKPENLIVYIPPPGSDQRPIVKIIDYGASCFKNTSSNRNTGTAGYAAPEQFNQKDSVEFLTSMDIFAAARVFSLLLGLDDGSFGQDGTVGQDEDFDEAHSKACSGLENYKTYLTQKKYLAIEGLFSGLPKDQQDALQHSDIGGDLKKVLHKMLSMNPKERGNIEDLLQNFADIRASYINIKKTQADKDGQVSDAASGLAPQFANQGKVAAVPFQGGLSQHAPTEAALSATALQNHGVFGRYQAPGRVSPTSSQPPGAGVDLDLGDLMEEIPLN